jgi:uncharacterized protein YbaR (Trm112 family)
METPTEITNVHQYTDIVCPISKAQLSMNKNGLWLYCIQSNMAYPIQNKIPVMLPTEARPLTDDERAILKAQ